MKYIGYKICMCFIWFNDSKKGNNFLKSMFMHVCYRFNKKLEKINVLY